MQNKIESYLKQFNLDIRRTRYSRFMDQKVTPDVLCFISDCITNLIADDLEKEFTIKDLWNSDYFKKNVKIIFGKPSPDNPNSSSEYDKFLAQPIKTLNYANILSSEKRGLTFYYKVKNKDILEYISIKERYSLNFLYSYLVKVLGDSDLLKYFDEFGRLYENNKLTENDFQELKKRFQKFIFGNTPINNKQEINRIFPKVLNVISNYRTLPGTRKGHLTDDVYPYFELMYNRTNFRDIGKNKSITRQEAVDQVDIVQVEDFNKYQIAKAMTLIRKKYSESEVKDSLGSGTADYVHHIFPKGEFPSIAGYLENLIKLTSAQHYSKAHPNAKTFLVDRDYQLVCLLSKADSIEKSINLGEFIYSKESFVFVINTGLSENVNPALSFREIKLGLNHIYKKG